jgi:hypothetical protein
MRAAKEKAAKRAPPLLLQMCTASEMSKLGGARGVDFSRSCSTAVS